MTKLSYPGSRLCWLAFGAIVGGNLAMHGVQEHSLGLALSGIGMGLFGILWFLSPIILGKTDGPLLAAIQRAALGPARLRRTLALGAIGCTTVGVVLRQGFDL